MAKVFIINDTSVTGGVASTSDLGTSSVTWRHAYLSGTITVGTVSATGAVIGVGGSISGTFTFGTVSATGNIVGSASLTISTGTIIAAKITATTGSFTALLTAGTASVSGDGIFGGALSFSTAATMVGERAYITFDFTSAASTTYKALPFNSKVIDCWTTTDTTPRSVSGFTLRAGSGGTVYVATVTSLVFNTAAGQQHQPALTPDVITTASALNVTVTTAGSAANFSATVVIQRTA